jgi:hypothetical protein
MENCRSGTDLQSSQGNTGFIRHIIEYAFMDARVFFSLDADTKIFPLTTPDVRSIIKSTIIPPVAQ